MKSTTRLVLVVTAALLATSLSLAGRAEAAKDHCLDADVSNDLILTEPCDVPGGLTKAYRHIHIKKNGVLNFLDGGETVIWARAILVEDGGTLKAGSLAEPLGTHGGRVTIHLYGETQGRKGIGVQCKSEPVETCGAPPGLFFSNVDPVSHKPKTPARKVSQLTAEDTAGYQGPRDDYFYAYHPLIHDDGDPHAYFGYKTLGVSYGGTLQLFGKKGAIYDGIAADKSCNPTGADSAKSTGRSWVRLARTANKAAATIYVETPPCGLDWASGDDIVLTTTDYLPGNSEQLKITATAVVKADDPEASGDPGLVGTTRISFSPALKHIHNGRRYPLDETTNPGISRVGLHPDLAQGAETRAAVALLSRSIRIYSAGTKVNEFLPEETAAACTSKADPTVNTCYFGGHTVFRQGFKAVQIQGVEFYQMGQGGRLGHYPVHFHHARKTQDALASRPPTFVMDSSIWDSMTRWIVLHGTQDVTLARNVGYKSIGHGFYLEDGTETNNKLLGNVGIFARAAVENDQNPRKVPGILAAPDLNNSGGAELPPYRSDYDHPTVFWIMNGWNDFQYNLAAGAGMCGVCYWMTSGAISTMSRDQVWESYASMQKGLARAGTAPLKSFVGNACTTAMTSFQTIINAEGCKGLAPGDDAQTNVAPILNPLAAGTGDLSYYPGLQDGGLFPVRCLDGKDCSSDIETPRCGENNPNCVVTVLDRYTTSFNWAAFNFAAIWLRPQWYLLTDSVITDSQQAGLTMVTGGGYDASSVIPGHWAVVRKSVFIGNTQDCPTCEIPVNPLASNGGPFNPTGLGCATKTNGSRPDEYCLSATEGISHQISNFGMYQRLFSVYDGPAFQDSNAYLNIKTRTLEDCKPGVRDGAHICVPTASGQAQSAWLAGTVLGLPKGYPDPLKPDPAQAFCFMPNAAIGWKQPNGFYYPPAFHSSNLYFHDVDVRHFVLTPLFEEGTLKTDVTAVELQYCKWNPGLFNGFTSNDRQTVLNDDDGSLTGYRSRVPNADQTQPVEFRGTTVVNLDDFFLAPVETIQCLSENSSRTSPFEYVTTVIYPACAVHLDPLVGDCAIRYPPPGDNPPANTHVGDWDRECTNEQCYGVPLWRQDLMPTGDLVDATDPSKGTIARSIRMAGQNIGQRSTLTVNHGTYYMDTSIGRERQLKGERYEGAAQPCPDPLGRNGGCLINVFRPGQSYYLLLIFAKEDTQQTYRFYAGPTGPGTPDDPAAYLNIKIVPADIKRVPIQFSPNEQPLPNGRARWFDKAKGVVEIVLKTSDLRGPGNVTFADLVNAAKAKKCLPATYCRWNGDANRCEDLNGSPDVCRWAVADVDCPDGGCFGIRFTLPPTFATDPLENPRPAATCLTADHPWDITLADPAAQGQFTPAQVAGACFQFKPLVNDFCK